MNVERRVSRILSSGKFDGAVVARTDGTELFRVGKPDAKKFHCLFSALFDGPDVIECVVRSIETETGIQPQLYAQGSAICAYTRTEAGFYLGIFATRRSKKAFLGFWSEAKEALEKIESLLVSSKEQLPLKAAPRSSELPAWKGDPEQLVRLEAFLEDQGRVRWFAAAGKPCEGAHVARDLSDAVDGYWRGWGPKGHAMWSKESHALERRARRRHGDKWIDAVFLRVGKALRAPVAKGVRDYLDRMTKRNPRFDPVGLNAAIAIDVPDRVLSDLSWAAVERTLGAEGFFLGLLPWYVKGRWPCGWRGGLPPKGAVVVL